MSLSPAIIAAALPAIRVAGKFAQKAVETSSNFANYLLEPLSSESALASDVSSQSSVGTLGQLVSELQQYLKSIGATEPSAVELKTDSEGRIEVAGEPALRQAVESWLKQNSQWADQWRSAAREFLANAPSGPNAFHAPANSLLDTQLRSRISASTFESWRRAS
ncbi:MAG: hypothetical protein SGI77_07260 [Pirellulaceae bacterium]|nr:hypothetical protein [Pirellulaceae bacterium]